MNLSETQIEIEKAYRDGFSHGYQAHFTNKDLSSDINAWAKEDIKVRIGAPGTVLSGKVIN